MVIITVRIYNLAGREKLIRVDTNDTILNLKKNIWRY